MGAAQLKDFVYAALSLVLANALAQEFSWSGKQQKKCFSGSYFVKILNCK